MSTPKKLGIWIDQSSAHLMEFNQYSIELKTIETEFNQKVKDGSLNKTESLMSNREEKQQSEYYSQLKDIIQNYENVLLFGHSDAKIDLYNILKEDQNFAEIKIEIENTDKMTDNQQHAFVKYYFRNCL